jgi:hypothetical protein
MPTKYKVPEERPGGFDGESNVALETTFDDAVLHSNRPVQAVVTRRQADEETIMLHLASSPHVPFMSVAHLKVSRIEMSTSNLLYLRGI